MIESMPILIGEDDEIDIMSIKRAFTKNDISNRLIFVQTGEELLQRLDSVDFLPGMILLDINIPKLSGLEVLDRIKATKHLRHIPVVMLTSSSEESDIKNAYSGGAAGYIVKPVDFESFIEVIKSLKEYWSINKIP